MTHLLPRTMEDMTHGQAMPYLQGDDTSTEASSSLQTPSQVLPYAGPVGASFHEQIMSILTPDRATLDLFYNLPPWVLEGDAIPASYVRHQLPRMGAAAWMNLDTASHLLRIQSAMSWSPIELFPVHDLFLLTQCAHMHQISTVVTCNGPFKLPTLLCRNVPHAKTFKLLLWWLYFNDEEDLQDQLESLPSPADLYGFAENVRYFGVVHRGLVQTMAAAIKSKQL